MTGVFASCLFLSFVLAAAVAFSSEKLRPRLKAGLFAAIVLCWAFLTLSIVQIVARTGHTLVTPGGGRQPHRIGSAAREGLTLLASLGTPALLATLLAVLAVKATRRPRKSPPSPRTP